jgi:hypothetical protein
MDSIPTSESGWNLFIGTFTLMTRHLKCAFCLLTIAAFGCRDEASHLFTKLDEDRTGIHFRNTLFENKDFNVLNYSYFYNGAGVAIGDINNDGLQDILFTGNMVKNRLYLNKGNFKFEDITDKSGASCSGGAQRWWTSTAMVSWIHLLPMIRFKAKIFIHQWRFTFRTGREIRHRHEGYSTHFFFDYVKTAT